MYIFIYIIKCPSLNILKVQRVCLAVQLSPSQAGSAINYDATITNMLSHHDSSPTRAHNIIDWLSPQDLWVCDPCPVDFRGGQSRLLGNTNWTANPFYWIASEPLEHSIMMPKIVPKKKRGISSDSPVINLPRIAISPLKDRRQATHHSPSSKSGPSAR